MRKTRESLNSNACWELCLANEQAENLVPLCGQRTCYQPKGSTGKYMTQILSEKQNQEANNLSMMY